MYTGAFRDGDALKALVDEAERTVWRFRSVMESNHLSCEIVPRSQGFENRPGYNTKPREKTHARGKSHGTYVFPTFAVTHDLKMSEEYFVKTATECAFSDSDGEPRSSYPQFGPSFRVVRVVEGGSAELPRKWMNGGEALITLKIGGEERGRYMSSGQLAQILHRDDLILRTETNRYKISEVWSIHDPQNLG